MRDLGLLPNFNFKFFNQPNMNSKVELLLYGSADYNFEICKSVLQLTSNFLLAIVK
jgi:hypothetical protein